MGAVRKLATVVILGLVALSTLFVVYLAAEPNRRDDETGTQDLVSIERGTQLYITYCLQCHGPTGLGNQEVDANGEPMGRVGMPLNQSQMTQDQLDQQKAIFQSDDPVQQGIAEDWLRFRIMYGAPSEGQLWKTYTGVPVMPAFRHDLNPEQLNDIVYLIMNGDWNYVYNTAVHQTGLTVCEATPEANRTDMCEGDMHDAVAYPTVPPPADAAGEASNAAASPEAEGDAAAAPTEGATDHALTAIDTNYEEKEITARPGDTITLTNTGFLEHDVAVDELGIDSDLITNGQTVTVTIPEDAEPGEYTYYCTVAGHRELGMEGTLIIEAP